MFNKKIIRDIKAKFNLNFQSCEPTVNEKEDNSSNRTNLEIACLITQYKKIYFTSKPQILNKLDPILQAHLLKLKRIDYVQYFLSKPIELNHKIIMIPDYEKEYRTILYNKSGSRQAFLLLLRDMQQNLSEFEHPGSWAESDNHFLTGALLTYPTRDILFFYKVAGFKEYLKINKTKDLKITEKKAFASWPENIKIEFYNFLKLKWPKSEIYQIYKRDKKEAQEWLQKHKKLSLKKIKLIIQGIEIKITEFNKSILLNT